MTDREITLEEALTRILDSRLADVHTALPGRVESYDASAETVDVRPLIRRAVPDADGETVLEDLPVIPSVPVLWPGAGGCFITFPLAVGDDVEIVFQERDTDQYRASGNLADPGVLATHGLSGAMAIPCAVREAVGADATHVKIVLPGGKELHVGGDSDAAALASRVKSLETALISHVHPSTSGTISASLELAPPAYTPQTFDSAKLKVDS